MKIYELSCIGIPCKITLKYVSSGMINVIAVYRVEMALLVLKVYKVQG